MKPQHLKLGALALILIATVLLALGGMFAGSFRQIFVYAPRERAVENTVRAIAEQQRVLHKSRGSYMTFAASDIDAGKALGGIDWTSAPTTDFYFDAEALENGVLRVRALPRPEAVTSLNVRPRYYTTELAKDGRVVREGWSTSTGYDS